MRKFIYYDTYGNILNVSYLSEHTELPEALPEGTVGFTEVFETIDSFNLMSFKYYDIEQQELVDKPAMPTPSPYYEWKDGWVFNNAKFLEDMRGKRNSLLSACDWTLTPDSPLTEEEKNSYLTYRTALRDLPNNLTGNEKTLGDIAWPSPTLAD